MPHRDPLSRWPKLTAASRLNLLCLLLTILVLLLQLSLLPGRPLLSVTICAAGFALALAIQWALSPLRKEIQALNLHVQNLQDGSFNTSANRLKIHELRGLANSLEHMSSRLRTERATLYQRELLLDTVLQSSPVALILTDAANRVLMSNPAARQLVTQGKPLNGQRLESAAAAVEELAQAITSRRQGLVRLRNDEIWHLSVSQFQLNQRLHWLYLFKPLTRVIQREEFAAWKKLLRVIGHELNNTLAPLSSLAFSGRQRASELDQPELAALFDTLNTQSRELNNFVQRYIAYAKLPPPKPQPVNWPRMINQIQDLYEFELLGKLPERVWHADPEQLQQVLVNLLKNAHESGSAGAAISLRFIETQAQLTLVIQDGGGGMGEQALSHALVPFFTTKAQGSGIGLTLCRDILEAHGGALQICNRGPGLEVTLTLPICDTPKI